MNFNREIPYTFLLKPGTRMDQLIAWTLKSTATSYIRSFTPYEYFARTYEESLWLLNVIAVDDKDEQSQSPEVRVNILPNEDFIVLLKTIPSNPFLGEDVSIEVTAMSPFGAIEEVELFIDYESFETKTDTPFIFTINSVQLGSYLILCNC